MESIHFPTRDYFPLFEVPFQPNASTQSTPFSSQPEKEVIIAVPNGKKAYLWFSNNGEDTAFLVPRNFKTQPEWTEIRSNLCTQSPEPFYGTLLSGTLVYPPQTPSQPKENNTSEYFVTDDIFYYVGISLTKSSFRERLEYLMTFFQRYIPITPITQTHSSPSKKKELTIVLAHMRGMLENSIKPTYRVHHWQLRNLELVSPFYALESEPRISEHKTPEIATEKVPETSTTTEWKFQTHYPIYKQKAVFRVLPEEACDVYTLYARNTKNNTEPWYSCGYAGIFEYKTSQILNHHCRNMVLTNLDQWEESDDEEPPEVQPQYFECIFSNKFRKWVPVRHIPHLSPEQTVSIEELATNQKPRISTAPFSKHRPPSFYKKGKYH
jgi:hypothetical protein